MEQLLSTKFYIPPTRRKLVSRPRLVERINQGLHRKLTLISAPAGFGKTTLVSEWIERSRADGEDKFSTAWLSLDEHDNDLVRFLNYFINALRKAEGLDSPLGKGALSMLQAPQPPPTESILTALVNDIASTSNRIILVLDDYHLISQPDIDDALNFLLEHFPPQLHLIINTRVDPQLPLARLRASNQLNELRATNLRFSSYEAAEFLNQVMGLALSEENITALENRTEGWVAGLQLAAISMQGREDTSNIIRSLTGSHRLVLDYLIEEVLHQQPKDLQDFLLQTAILERLTGPLCNAVTGKKDSQATLEMLDHANLFIIPLDEERHWYRYHHLFADLLRQRLHQTQSENLTSLHAKAGKWFHHQERIHEAIKHLLAAKDYPVAAKLIKKRAIDIIQRGEHATVVNWINSLPDELVKEQPYLCILHAWALQLSGQLETGESRLLNAESALETLKSQDDEDIDTILGLIHSRRAYKTFMTGDHDKTIYYAKQALEELPETTALLRIQTALYLGIAHRYLGELRAALDIYNEVLPVTQKIGNKSISVTTYLHLGDLYAEMAQLHRAKEIYEEAFRFTEHYTGNPEVPFTGYIYVSIGRVLRQWNQLEDAYHFTTKGVKLCRDWKVADILALSCLEQAYLYQTLGKVAQARELLKEAGQIMAGVSAWGSQIAAAHQAIFDIACGDIDSADYWAQKNDLDTDGDFIFHREIEYFALTRLLIAQKRYEEAYSLAEQIYRIAQEIGKSRTELEALILLTVTLSLQEKTDQTLVHLEKALSIGEPEDFIRIFIDEGPPMARLLYEALDRGISPNYISRLLNAFPKQPTPDDTQDINTNLIEPLTDRELEVLHLIAEGLTNQEVAERLFLSMNTVKVHTRNIFGKLNVSSRTQAVIKAKALGILPPD